MQEETENRIVTALDRLFPRRPNGNPDGPDGPLDMLANAVNPQLFGEERHGDCELIDYVYNISRQLERIANHLIGQTDHEGLHDFAVKECVEATR
jgi:hypothetical protein